MEFIVICHNIRSVHNVGSIFRTADGAGVQKIWLCGITPTPLDRFDKVRSDFAKVALGAEDSVQWEHAKSTAVVMKKIKKEGWTILALEQSKGSVPYYRKHPRSQKKIACVLGAEVDGIPSSILKIADKIIEIPMAGKKESLNVAVAFGIVVFDLRFGSAALDATIEGNVEE